MHSPRYVPDRRHAHRARLRLPIVSAIALTILLVASARAADDALYLKQVKPLLQRRCYACHGALKQESGLRLDTGELARQGGDSGEVIQPGVPDESVLIERISAVDEGERMPPEGKPLEAGEIDIIRDWISAGANSPSDEKMEPDPRDHWAFRGPVRPPRLNSPSSSDAKIRLIRYWRLNERHEVFVRWGLRHRRCCCVACIWT